MALILDHINGVADDNRLENLRIVCPNCAATLDTHCGRQNRRSVEIAACLHCGSVVPSRRSRASGTARARAAMRCATAGAPRSRRRRVERPPYEQLVAEVAATSWSAVGRKYGVSDNAVRSGCARTSANAPRRRGDVVGVLRVSSGGCRLRSKTA